MNGRLRNLFLLRVVGEGGQPGAGEGSDPANPPGGGEPGGEGGGTPPGGEPPKAISVQEHKKVQREAQNLRTRLRAEETAKTKALEDFASAQEQIERLKAHFGIEDIDALPPAPSGDGGDPPKRPANPPAPAARSAEAIRLEKEQAQLRLQIKALTEKAEREHRDKIKSLRDGVINAQIQQSGITDPQEIEVAFAALDKRTLTHEMEDGTVTFTQKFMDPKTKEELEEAPSVQTASLILPKSLQPARSGPGSGGSTPRLSSDPKDNDILTKAISSQAEYDRTRAQVIAAERANQARAGGRITTADGDRSS